VQPTRTIRLLSTDRNEKGDLFTRLTGDLFFALGYGELERDLAQPGREIDVLSKHRTEPRQMCAECKAHQKKMGGDEVNKFRGALLGEQRKPGALPTTGYFVSLGGFKASAVEQERVHGVDAIIFLDAPRIIQELEGGHFLVDDVKATAQAARCAERADLHDIDVYEIELLGHQLGYIKAVYFAHNNQPTHVALIHADGKPLPTELAMEVYDADKASGGSLHLLKYLAPAPSPPDLQQQKEQAQAFYRSWIGEECGYMQLDGLPLDNHKGPKKPRLEKLYVPLRASLRGETSHQAEISHEEDSSGDAAILPFGKILATHQHIALLAAPGGGKSTLLKRLALAYAFEERHGEIQDELPEKQWLPLFLRCRDLRKRVSKPIMQLLEKIPQRIEMPAELAKGFRAVLQESLRAGQVLLLIDGLDEIASERKRKRFADNLRRFLAAYPQVAMVVTSRIAGFRIIAGVIGQVCYEAELAPLTEDDIRALCLQWHLEVGKDSSQERATAHQLAEQILANASLLTLAQNPLLLTTLLAVRRNLGELPTNRADLYREAVKLLVRTWNVEGFKPMPEREAMAQLCYVACSMMELEKQQIAHDDLVGLLIAAREILAADLQYTKLSPEEFIAQIEHRSSLLMLVGHEKINGKLQYVYEFRHLTFQEYLAAEGYVRKRHRRRLEGKPLVDLLSLHLHVPSWEEVISLATVLADEFEAEPLVEVLIADCEHTEVEPDNIGAAYASASILARCLVDEVTVSPQLLRKALQQVARFGWNGTIMDSLLAIRRGRSGGIFTELVEENYLSGEVGWEEYSATHRHFSSYTLFKDDVFDTLLNSPNGFEALLTLVLDNLSIVERSTQVRAALAFVELTLTTHFLAYRQEDLTPTETPPHIATQLIGFLDEMIRSNDPACVYAAAWAYQADATGGGRLLADSPISAATVMGLFNAWRTAATPRLAKKVAYALVRFAPVEPNLLNGVATDGLGYKDFLEAKFQTVYDTETGSAWEAGAAVLMNWYWREIQEESMLASMIDMLNRLFSLDNYLFGLRDREDKRITTMLQALGQAGQDMLTKQAKRRHKPASELSF
jgi:hypothetical protein